MDRILYERDGGRGGIAVRIVALVAVDSEVSDEGVHRREPGLGAGLVAVEVVRRTEEERDEPSFAMTFRRIGLRVQRIGRYQSG